MKFAITILLIVLSKFSTAQSCSCSDDYYFIKSHIEKNHGGFNKKIKSPEEPAYKKFTQALEQEIKKDQSGKYCISYLKKYILYLQDHHSNITAGGGTAVNETITADVEAFQKSSAYLNTELLKADSNKLISKWAMGNPGNIEGIYYTPDSTYVTALIKNKTSYRDYAAVILRSKTKLWTPGQVKFELKQVNDSLFDAYISYRNHSINYDQVVYKKERLQMNGWIKAGETTAASTKSSNELIQFRLLDSSTVYLSITSFDAVILSKLDSAYKVIIPQIKKYPKLIIDVRNNGGGSDAGYMALMPLLYTDPFESDLVEFYATPGNIQAYKSYDENLRKNSPGSKGVFINQVAKMEKATPYSFIYMGDGTPRMVKYPENKGYPDKIAVLYNRNCASSCESFLFEILNSSKVIRAGENSGGYTGYGNVMNIQTPCGNTLSWTTTVYRNQWKYEFVGIPPQYKIPEEETDWIEYTRKLLQ
jgi:hypothetical protein